MNNRINSIIWIESFYPLTLNRRTTRCLGFALAKYIDSSFFEESFFISKRKRVIGMNISNFFVTGDRGVGKSTLLQMLLEELALQNDISGFVTLPYFENHTRKGFYLHSIIEVRDNDKPISIQEDAISCKSIPDTFETLGVTLLKISLKEHTNHIVMDELGVLEAQAYNFQRQVQKVLDSPKIVLGVLKDKQHPFLDAIKDREDTRLYRITKENRTKMREQIRCDYLNRFSNK